MQSYLKLEPVQNVLATGHFVLSSKLVLGNVIEQIVLDKTGSGSLTDAMITNLVVKLNGKVVFGPISATNLRLLEQYLTGVNTVGFLSIFFTEPRASTKADQLLGAISTPDAGVVDFTIEGDITGATTPFLAAWAVLRSPESLKAMDGYKPATAAFIRGLIPTTLAPSAAGEFPFDLNYGSRGESLIKRALFFSTIVTGLRVKRDNVELYGNAPILNANASYLQSLYGESAQANMVVFDELLDGHQSDALATRQLLANGTAREAVYQWLLTVSGAGTIVAYTDVYSTLDRL
jgi:Viral coat protein P2 N-terminal domain